MFCQFFPETFFRGAITTAAVLTHHCRESFWFSLNVALVNGKDNIKHGRFEYGGMSREHTQMYHAHKNSSGSQGISSPLKYN